MISLTDRLLLFEGVQSGVTYASELMAEYVSVAMAAGQTRQQAEAPFTDTVGYWRKGQTNLLLWSEDFSNSAWVKRGGISVLNGVVEITSTDSVPYEINQAVSPNQPRIWSFEVEDLGGKYFFVGFNGLGYAERFAIFDLELGTVARQFNASLKVASITPSDVSGRYVCTVYAPDAVDNSIRFGVAFEASGNTSEVINSSATLGTKFKIYKAWVNEGATALPYVKTESEQAIPNMFDVGTNDAVRGSSTAVATDDPAIVSEAWQFDGVNDLIQTPLVVPSTNFTMIWVGKVLAVPTLTNQVFGSPNTHFMYIDKNSAEDACQLKFRIDNGASFNFLNGSEFPHDTYVGLVTQIDNLTGRAALLSNLAGVTSVTVSDAVSDGSNLRIYATNSNQTLLRVAMLFPYVFSIAELGYMFAALENLGVL